MGLLVRSADRLLHAHRRGRSPVPVTLSFGRAALVNPDGSVEWIDSEWMPNFLADEGEASVLNVYFREQANVAKYLALLTATPTDTTTMATMVETRAPGTDGYARVQVAAGDWGAPALNAGDMMTTAVEKTFGPASGNPWAALTYLAMVTTSTGTAGLFLAAIALSSSTTVAVDQSFTYQLAQKCA